MVEWEERRKDSREIVCLFKEIVEGGEENGDVGMVWGE